MGDDPAGKLHNGPSLLTILSCGIFLLQKKRPLREASRKGWSSMPWDVRLVLATKLSLILWSSRGKTMAMHFAFIHAIVNSKQFGTK